MEFPIRFQLRAHSFILIGNLQVPTNRPSIHINVITQRIKKYEYYDVLEIRVQVNVPRSVIIISVHHISLHWSCSRRCLINTIISVNIRVCGLIIIKKHGYKEHIIRLGLPYTKPNF